VAVKDAKWVAHSVFDSHVCDLPAMQCHTAKSRAANTCSIANEEVRVELPVICLDGEGV
jgi:hypothetical protein